MGFYQGIALHLEAFTRRKAMEVCAKTLKFEFLFLKLCTQLAPYHLGARSSTDT